MIDLHAHVLPGVDDGPADLAAAVRMATEFAREGTTAVAATSHVSDEYPNRAGALATAVDLVQSELRSREIPVRIVAGAEVALSKVPFLADEELLALRLGAGPFLLIESPLSPLAGDPETEVRALQDRGFRVVLAHPERSPVFQRDRNSLMRLVSAGALCSITAGALVGQFGRTAREFSNSLIEEGLAHNIASDAHDTNRRPPGLILDGLVDSPAIGGDPSLIRWLTTSVPSAVLSGDPIPTPPPRLMIQKPSTKPRWFRLGR